MERVTDEVTTYVEREGALRLAYHALCKRFGIERGDVKLGREDRIRLVYKGTVDVGHDNTMKDYELYVLR